MNHRAVLPAHQARSRESSRRLLDAAVEVLGQHGVEGATIPRIAHHAGLTPGSVYRRFKDKDALLETAILQILERQEEKMKTSMAPAVPAGISLADFTAQVIGGMVQAYRANAGLLRGMRQFVQRRAHTAFGKKVSELELSHFQRAADLFLSYREQFGHPHPRTAVSLALIMVIGTLYQLVVLPEDPKRIKEILPLDDRALTQELTRAFLSYLDAKN